MSTHQRIPTVSARAWSRRNAQAQAQADGNRPGSGRA